MNHSISDILKVPRLILRLTMQKLKKVIDISLLIAVNGNQPKPIFDLQGVRRTDRFDMLIKRL